MLDHPALILILFLSTLGLNVFLIAKVPKGFFLTEDTGVSGWAGWQGPQSTSFYSMEKAVKQSVDIIKADPGVQNVMAFTGGRGGHQHGVRVHRAQAFEGTGKR